MKLKKLRKLIKEFKSIKEEGFAGSGVGGVAGIGVAVGGDKSQAEPGVLPKDQPKFKKKSVPKSPVMSNFRRNPPKI